MKVIFLEDVPNIAGVGETKEVADGYGRNFLIPRKLAVLAGSHAATMVAAKLRMKVRQKAQVEAEMQELSKQIEGQEIVLKAKTGESDRLYGSITTSDIADEIKKIIGLDIDKKKIELEESIRQVGSYELIIRLTKDVTPKIKLTVVAEEKEAVKDAEPKVEVVKKTKKAARKQEAKKGKAAGEETKAKVTKAKVTKAKVTKAKVAKATKVKAAKAEEPEATDVKPEETKEEAAKVEEPEVTDVKTEEAQ